MKFSEFVDAVSTRSSVEAESARSVLEAAFGILSKKFAKEDVVRVKGFGTFVRKIDKKTDRLEKTFRFQQEKARVQIGRAKRLTQGGKRVSSARAFEKRLTGIGQSQAVPVLRTRGADVAEPAATIRTILFHYHLFKNAGTSVDEMLHRNFGARWVKQEFQVPRHANAGAVAAFMEREHPAFDAISSHTALLLSRRIENVEIFPIVFIRHPIDRLRSAYEFERRQDAATPGARLAKAHDLAGYLRELLRNKYHRQARNFQTFFLCANTSRSLGTERERAIHVAKTLPFVGLVEDFAGSIQTLQQLIKPMFPKFTALSVHKNAGRHRGVPLEERLAAIAQQLGRTLYEDMCAANEDDLALYEEIRGTHADRCPPSIRVTSAR